MREQKIMAKECLCGAVFFSVSLVCCFIMKVLQRKREDYVFHRKVKQRIDGPIHCVNCLLL